MKNQKLKPTTYFYNCAVGLFKSLDDIDEKVRFNSEFVEISQLVATKLIDFGYKISKCV